MIKDLSQLRQIFLDMDGTIYHGSTIYPTTIPFLKFLKERGVGYVFISNNSSYTTEEYVERLQKLGIECGPENFYLSTDYTIDYLKQNHPEIRKIHLLSMKSLEDVFRKAGFLLTNTVPDAVIVAFDRTLTYEKLCTAAWFLHKGVPGFATHPDVFCPTDQQTWLPDCGAITKCLETATNKVIKVLGKPDPDFLRQAVKRNGVEINQTLVVGDRLSTDIALGMNVGAITCHIMNSEAELVIPEGIVPDYSVANLGELRLIMESKKNKTPWLIDFENKKSKKNNPNS